MRSFLLAVTLLCAACGPTPLPPEIAAPEPPHANFEVGDLDKEGRLIFWSVDAFDHIEPFTLLKEDYGVVLFNDGTEDQPAARYIIAIQNTRTIVSSSDFAVFKETLAKIPRGSTTGRFDTCSMSRTHGLPKDVRSQFEQALIEADLRIEDRVVCYCPDKH